MCENHAWVQLYHELYSDYTPSHNIWWCERCGTVYRCDMLDNRRLNEQYMTPNGDPVDLTQE